MGEPADEVGGAKAGADVAIAAQHPAGEQLVDAGRIRDPSMSGPKLSVAAVLPQIHSPITTSCRRTILVLILNPH